MNCVFFFVLDGFDNVVEGIGGVQNARNRRPRTLPKDMSKTAQKLNENAF